MWKKQSGGTMGHGLTLERTRPVLHSSQSVKTGGPNAPLRGQTREGFPEETVLEERDPFNTVTWGRDRAPQTEEET